MVGGHDKECVGSVTFQIKHRILQSILALQTNTYTQCRLMNVTQIDSGKIMDHAHANLIYLCRNSELEVSSTYTQ